LYTPNEFVTHFVSNMYYVNEPMEYNRKIIIFLIHSLSLLLLFSSRRLPFWTLEIITSCIRFWAGQHQGMPALVLSWWYQSDHSLHQSSLIQQSAHCLVPGAEVKHHISVYYILLIFRWLCSKIQKMFQHKLWNHLHLNYARKKKIKLYI
jgi:hypothetical protein